MVYPSLFLPTSNSVDDLPNDLVHLFHGHVCVPVRRNRPPVIEVITELTISATEVIRLQMNARHTVMTTSTPVAADLGFGYAGCSFRHVINDANTARNPCADDRAGTVHAMVVIDLDPIVVLDAKLVGIDLAHPTGLTAP